MESAYFVSSYNNENRKIFVFIVPKVQFWKIYNLRELNKHKYLYIDKDKLILLSLLRDDNLWRFKGSYG